MTRLTGALSALLLTAFAAGAQTAPWGLAYVTPKAEAAPLHDGPGGAVVGQTGDAAVIEAAPDGDWLRIVDGEFNAWVRRSDVSPAAPATLANGALPDGLSCFGVEPFWSLHLSSAGVRYSELGGDDAALRLVSLTSPVPGFATARFTGLRAGRVEIARADCSDGMSDAVYPWRVNLTMEVADAPPRLSGCCRFAPPAP